jgi:hypothetical protein
MLFDIGMNSLVIFLSYPSDFFNYSQFEILKIRARIRENVSIYVKKNRPCSF